jgi:hypothetical protein
MAHTAEELQFEDMVHRRVTEEWNAQQKINEANRSSPDLSKYKDFAQVADKLLKEAWEKRKSFSEITSATPNVTKYSLSRKDVAKSEKKLKEVVAKRNELNPRIAPSDLHSSVESCRRYLDEIDKTLEQLEAVSPTSIKGESEVNEFQHLLSSLRQHASAQLSRLEHLEYARVPVADVSSGFHSPAETLGNYGESSKVDSVNHVASPPRPQSYLGTSIKEITTEPLANKDSRVTPSGQSIEAPSIVMNPHNEASTTGDEFTEEDEYEYECHKGRPGPMTLEEVFGQETTSLSQIIKGIKLPKKPFLGGKKKTSSKMREFIRHLRYVNFLRALMTTVYGFQQALRSLSSPSTQRFQAYPFYMITLVFLALDFLITFAKAFPTIFWFCWDVRKWDPFSRSFSIWNLVADHELLLDMTPVLVSS